MPVTAIGARPPRAVGATFLLFAVAGGLGLALAWLLPLGYFLLIFLGQGAVVLLAYRMPSFSPEETPTARGALPAPRVSVVVPARNEREDILRCLDDLAHQDYAHRGGAPLEVIVVDGRSEDGTAAAAREHPSHPQVLVEPPLPAGWVGKNWACHLGSQQATGDLLLFLDADVRLAPSAVRTAVAAQQATAADLVSFAARIVMRGFWEKVVMPLYVQFVLLYFVAPRVNVDTSSRAMANGQFLLFTRPGYQKVGGHERVRGAVLEDVRLAQEVKRGGGRLRLYWVPELVETRMYASRSEMDEGILKNLHGTSFSASRQVGLALALFLFFLSPFLVLALGALGVLSGVWAVAALLLVALTAVKQVGFQRAVRAPAAFGLLYPLGALYYLGLFGRSIRRGLGGRTVSWKGRSYPMDSE